MSSSSHDRPIPPFPKQRQQMSGNEGPLRPQAQHTGKGYRPASKLEGKCALITGGDSGIGRAIAILYAREGADVALVYLPDDQQDAEQTRQLVEQEGRRAVLIPGDVRDASFCRRAVERTVRELGKLDILVNNAAYCMFQDSLDQVTDEQLDRTFRTNIYGYFYMARAALPHLKPGSCIIMTGSGAGVDGMKQAMDYAATKAAIHSFTKSLASSVTDKGIRVNCVAPGPVWTPLVVVSQPPESSSTFGKSTPMGRPAQPDEIAPAFVFLASDADSSYVSGEILCIFGGTAAPG
jgi:NAD(P)-dependent dehydrogenase (short-subunit alcohol dehydrogenase family)